MVAAVSSMLVLGGPKAHVGGQTIQVLGRVVDADGKPVSGALVTLTFFYSGIYGEPRDFFPSIIPRPVAKTHRDGSFQFTCRAFVNYIVDIDDNSRHLSNFRRISPSVGDPRTGTDVDFADIELVPSRSR